MAKTVFGINVTFLTLFFTVLLLNDLMYKPVEGKICEKPSGTFHGTCVYSDDCNNNCVTREGAGSGLCHYQFPSFRFLSKAAIIIEGETNIDGTSKETSKWTLCSTIQQVEEVKCLIKVLPIWLSGIICFLAAARSSTFAINQAMIMNRHLGPKFEIPPDSISTVGMLAVGIWVPIYDRFVVPLVRKYTKREDGITLLQRMGIGLFMSVLSMFVAGLVEKKRRDMANNEGKIASVWLLVPQLVILGLAEGFNFIGQIEFYNKQFLENLRSMATSLFFCTIAGASYLSTVIVSVVHSTTGGHGKPDWITNDLNQGRVDYFYYLIGLLGVINMIYFVIVAKRYRYKETRAADEKEMISIA